MSAATFIYYVRKAASLPPHVLLRKFARRLRVVCAAKILRYKALHRTPETISIGFGESLLCNVASLSVEEEGVSLQKLVPFWLAHRFDLLGSGWVKWDGGHEPIGVCGHRYGRPVVDAALSLPEVHRTLCRVIRQRIPVKGYEFIDWQRDVKSGFRFDDSAWHLDQPIGRLPGVDIKLPWEIGRLQHLPQMARVALGLLEHEPDLALRLVAEYEAQVLDFLSANPVGVGAQWTCTMDVGIRAANLVLARELFAGVRQASPDFELVFAQALHQHGRFIVQHLEWSETLTSNHYLSNVCGLVFLSRALASTPETDAWLAFACDQVIHEFGKQFYKDGANFEASSSYHRLSLEMVCMTFAVMCGLSLERLARLGSIDLTWLASEPSVTPQWEEHWTRAMQTERASELIPQDLWDRTYRAALVTRCLIKPNGDIIQTGDNDSGRFFRVTVDGLWYTPEEVMGRYQNLQGYTKAIAAYRMPEELFFDENMLDHRGVLGMAAGLFSFDAQLAAQGFSFEREIVAALCRGGVRAGGYASAPSKAVLKAPPIEKMPHTTRSVLYEDCAQKAIGLCEGGAWTHFPDAGWHVYRSKRVYLHINAGGNGQNGNGGHAHNDRLHVELQVDGVDILSDPGTGLYTPAPAMRNSFRSSAAHNGPCLFGEEQNRLAECGLFWMPDEATAWLVACELHSITCALQLKQGVALRTVTIGDQRIYVEDQASWQSGQTASKEMASICLGSPGYGKLSM